MQKKYLIITYGCQMNVHESEKLAGVFKSLNYIETTKREEADVIVFNTCCIRKGAEDKALGNIGALKSLKQKKKDLIIAIGGCMTEQKGIAESITKKFPYIDIVFGTKNLFKFKELLQEKEQVNKRIIRLEEDDILPAEGGEVFRTSGDNAYININYGCNNFCTYCIVPYVRGRERSRKIPDIVAEFKEVIKNPEYKTITLLGQNVNSYGKDLTQENQKINFVTLLSELVKIEWNGKIRFMTSHPKDASVELIEFIGKNLNKMSNEFHLPVQSGNNRILSIMNRNYTREHYLNLVKLIRENIPNCYLTTDILVGFPTETDEEFMDTYNLIKEVKFNNLFAYLYNPRSGTPAEKMEGQIPLSIKKKRVNTTLKLLKDIQKERG